MIGRNVLRINYATVIEALEQYFEILLDEEGMKIDSIEELEDDGDHWFQLVLIDDD